MKDNKKIFTTFFREKPAMILIELFSSPNETYASSLAKNVDCTYSHVVKVLKEMETFGLISFEKTGRLKVLKLTEKGKKIASLMSEMRKAL